MVNIAAVFWASFKRCAIRSLIRFILTRCSVLVPVISLVGSWGGSFTVAVSKDCACLIAATGTVGLAGEAGEVVAADAGGGEVVAADGGRGGVDKVGGDAASLGVAMGDAGVVGAVVSGEGVSFLGGEALLSKRKQWLQIKL